jgi:hypothetical protein
MEQLYLAPGHPQAAMTFSLKSWVCFQSKLPAWTAKEWIPS